MKEIPLTQGKTAMVDNCDFERVAALKWCYIADRKDRSDSGFAARYIRRGSRMTVLPMSNFILSVKGIVDHKNGNRLDNRRDNLRPCTQAQNNKNKRAYRRTSHPELQGLKGVYYRPLDHGKPRKNPYFARITSDKVHYGGGYHRTAEDVARAYDRLAIQHHGEFARLNFPETLKAEKAA